MIPHVVAGLTSDANILINQARLAAQRYYYSYQEPIPVEQLVRSVCDYKQAYTQFGGTLWQSAFETWVKRPITTLNMDPFYIPRIRIGLRPFGVSFLFAGWDRHHGFQLYESDPAGTFGGWSATVIGANFQVQSFLHEYDRVFHVFSMPHAISLCSFAMSLVSQSGKGLLKNEYAEGADTETNLKLATKVSDQSSCTLPRKSDVLPLSMRWLLSCMPQWADVCPTCGFWSGAAQDHGHHHPQLGEGRVLHAQEVSLQARRGL